MLLFSYKRSVSTSQVLNSGIHQIRLSFVSVWKNLVAMIARLCEDLAEKCVHLTIAVLSK